MMTDAPLILLTTDFSPEAARAYRQTVELAQRTGGRILLVHVVEVAAVAPHGSPLAPTQLPPDIGPAVERAQAQVENEAATLGAGVAVEAIAVPDSNVADAVCRLAKDRGASLIAISTHGRTGLRRLILGSVAEAIVRRSTVPVLAFPQG